MLPETRAPRIRFHDLLWLAAVVAIMTTVWACYRWNTAPPLRPKSNPKAGRLMANAPDAKTQKIFAGLKCKRDAVVGDLLRRKAASLERDNYYAAQIVAIERDYSQLVDATAKAASEK